MNKKIYEAIMLNAEVKAFYERGMEIAETDEQKQIVMIMCIQMIPNGVQMLGEAVYNQCRA